MPHTALRRTVVAACLLAPLALAAPASAQDGEDVPAELGVTMSGPATGTAGGSGQFAVGVSNDGTTPARAVRVTLQLPAAVSVVSVGVTDDWACVVAPEDRESPMSCQLESELPAGEVADPIPVTLSYAEAGSHELAALAAQDTGGLRIDRGTTTVAVAAAASPSPSAAPPATAGPSPAPAPRTTTAAPAPVARATSTAAPAQPPAPAADAPVPVVVEEAGPLPAAVDTPAATAPTTPAALPFVEEEEPAQEPDTETTAAAAVDDDNGISTLLLSWVFGASLLAMVVLLWRILTGRSVPLRS